MSLLFCLTLGLTVHAQELLIPPDTGTEATARPPCKDCSRARHVEEQVKVVKRVSSRCDLKAVAAHARRIGGSRTKPNHHCLPYAREAFKAAGCPVPAGFRGNAMISWASLKNVWRCKAGGTARSAPEGAVIFSKGCGSNHTEVASNDGGKRCYYSDFHHPNCKASSEYYTCKYRQLGWCVP